MLKGPDWKNIKKYFIKLAKKRVIVAKGKQEKKGHGLIK